MGPMTIDRIRTRGVSSGLKFLLLTSPTLSFLASY